MAVSNAIRSLAPVCCFRMPVSFLCLPLRASQTCNTLSVPSLEATRLHVRYQRTFTIVLSPLSHSGDAPQPWARRRQDFVFCCVHQAVFLFHGVDLESCLAPSRAEQVFELFHNCCTPWCLTVSAKLWFILLQSIRYPRANARFSPRLHRLSCNVDRNAGLVGSVVCIATSNRGRYVRKVVCRPTLCGLQSGLVSSMFVGLEYVLLHLALIMPATSAPYSFSPSVRDVDCFGEIQNHNAGLRGGGRLHCALRALHLG